MLSYNPKPGLFHLGFPTKTCNITRSFHVCCTSFFICFMRRRRPIMKFILKYSFSCYIPLVCRRFPSMLNCVFCWPCVSIHLCNENQLDALFILSLFCQSTSTCFGHICSPPLGGILYIYSIPPDDESIIMRYTLYIQYTSRWCCTNMSETYIYIHIYTHIYLVYYLMMGYKYVRNIYIHTHTHIYIYIYIYLFICSIPPDDGLQTCPKYTYTYIYIYTYIYT